VSDIRTYLRFCTVSKAGLVISLKTVPYQLRQTEQIVIPRLHAFTFAKALHVKLDHPVHDQMQKQFSRQYFMLDEAKTLKSVFKLCKSPCRASMLLPKEFMQHQTETKPSSLSQHMNADVLEEAKQKILVLRENQTSFTVTALLKDQTKQTLRDSLYILASRLALSKPIKI
jgi:hypothetical protein